MVGFGMPFEEIKNTADVWLWAAFIRIESLHKQWSIRRPSTAIAEVFAEILEVFLVEVCPADLCLVLNEDNHILVQPWDLWLRTWVRMLLWLCILSGFYFLVSSRHCASRLWVFCFFVQTLTAVEMFESVWKTFESTLMTIGSDLRQLYHHFHFELWQPEQ